MIIVLKSKVMIVIGGVVAVGLVIFFAFVFLGNTKINDDVRYGKRANSLKLHIPVCVLAQTTNHDDWLDIDLDSRVIYKRSRITKVADNETVSERQKTYKLSDNQFKDLEKLLSNIETYVGWRNDSVYMIEYQNSEYYFTADKITDIFTEKQLKCMS